VKQTTTNGRLLRRIRQSYRYVPSKREPLSMSMRGSIANGILYVPRGIWREKGSNRTLFTPL
jgi:hypothetical protein